MLTIEPGVPAARWRRANSRAAEERAVERDVHDRAPGVGRHVLAGHREVGRRVVDEHPGQAERVGSAASKAAAICVGLADVAGDGDAPPPPVASMAARAGVAGARACGWRCTIDAAEPGELGGDGLAQAGAAAGDEHAGAVEGARQAAPSAPTGGGPAAGQWPIDGPRCIAQSSLSSGVAGGRDSSAARRLALRRSRRCGS